ncbi:MAG: hypothetical protein HOQ14_15635 [Gemmatimonadaceae bacterium]|nr:hypothetical protein [Gemmatimonadaceae bacterium]
MRCLLVVTLASGCSGDAATRPMPAPMAGRNLLAGGDTVVGVQMIAADDPTIDPGTGGGAGGGSVPPGMTAFTLTIPQEAIDDPAFFTADTQEDGPCDATRNAEIFAWAEFVAAAYAGGATVLGSAGATVGTAGAAAPVTVFVTLASSYTIAKAYNNFLGLAKENQFCRLRNRLYPYNHT